MKNLNDVRGEDFEVIISDWEENIRTAFKHNVFVFHSSIWNMSLTAFDKPRERILVVI